MKYKYILSAALVGTMLGTTSCTGDLETVPIDKDDLVSEVVFGSDISAYEESLAKIYAGLVIGGNKGGDDEQDVVGIDGGSQCVVEHARIGFRYGPLLLERPWYSRLQPYLLGCIFSLGERLLLSSVLSDKPLQCFLA